MAHMSSKSYHRLQRRLDQAPQGAPPSEALFKILEVLFSQEEAELVSVLPINMFTVHEAARLWRKSDDQARTILDELADKGILFDLAGDGTQAYMLTPAMAGFFEFSLMRMDGRFDKKVLSELYYQYVNTEEDFIRGLFSIEPSILRAFVYEDTIQEKDKVVVLDYERAARVIDTATCITVGICYCRHKMEHLGKACSNPQEVCLTFNKAAESLSRHRIARQIGPEEAHRILEQCIELGLVQIGDNVQEGVNWICNCCSCCCEALLSYRKLGYNSRITTNFVSRHAGDECNACGSCVEQCPVDAIELCHSKNGYDYARVDEERCIGCGLCVRCCPTGSRVMERRKETAFVPKDSFERVVASAISTGRLQHLLLDNRTLWTHDMLRRLLGVILASKPARILLSQRQLRSRFLEMVIRTQRFALVDRVVNNGKKPDYSHPELAREPPTS
jgi:NAD-dependent dihydropyrimidine dehydrogenase PreA subunit